MTRIFATMIAAVLTVAYAPAAEQKFTLNGENTKLIFAGYKPEGKHEGGFKKVTGTATVDGADLTSLKIMAEIDMDSTYSDDEKLTAHLKSPDFFGVKANPKSKFVSSKVEKNDDGYTVHGKLTLNGKTKEVAFPAKISMVDGALNLNASFKIDRNNWGISYGKGKINDEVGLGLAIIAKN